ncbi:MAG: dihydrolipoyl dehydrogenase [Planctomycetales bacterium]
MDETFDLVIIGGGPGGYVAALKAAQYGLKIACIEKEPVLGGTCLRVGCIPSKAMLESSHLYHEAQNGFAAHGIKFTKVQLDLAAMLARKEQVVASLTKGIDALFKRGQITRLLGTGRLDGPGKVVVTQNDQTTVTLQAKNIIIATGSKVATIPGVVPDGDRIGTSTEALSYTSVPQHLVVIGGGYIGLEMGSVWKRLGSQVTVLEFLPRLLPGSDLEIAQEALKIFKKQGFDIHLGTKVKSATAQGKKCIVEVEGGEPISCDRVLLAVGRAPYTEGLGLETVGIQLDERKRIPVSEHWETSAPGIYAIGDCTPGPMLAHKAEEEGSAVAEYIATGYGHVNYDVIPAVVYTHPEIASVGQTEEQLKEANVAYKKGLFQFRANSRARTINDVEGFVKILADAQTDRVLGVHIIGPHAGDMIAEAAAAMEFGASSEDLARTCHAHPTLSEALKEAAMAVTGKPLHA